MSVVTGLPNMQEIKIKQYDQLTLNFFILYINLNTYRAYIELNTELSVFPQKVRTYGEKWVFTKGKLSNR